MRKLAKDIDPRRIEAVLDLAEQVRAPLARARFRRETGLLDEAIADLRTRCSARWVRGLRILVGMCHPRQLGDTFSTSMRIEGREWLRLLETLPRRCRRLLRELGSE